MENHVDVSDDDPTISQLVAMSEYYLHQTPPLVSESVRCLIAVLTLSPPPRVEARIRLQLGLVLYHHTNNLVEARQHLDRAVLISQSAANLHDVSFEASSLSVRIMVEQKALHQAKSLLRARLDHSTHHPYWNIRLLLQLADIYLIERDENAVLSTLDRCIEYARQVNAPYTRLLCLLYKGAFLLTHHHYHQAGEVLNITNTLKDNYHGTNKTLIRTFYLVVQVTHLLMAGQVKAAKPHLKQLQQQVKTLSSEDQPMSAASQSDDSTTSPDSFQWLTSEQTFILVYLVSVMHSVQGGYTDKALSYADKAMQLLAQSNQDTGVTAILKAHLLEHTISCLLVQGKAVAAGEKLQEAISVCHAHSQLVYSHRAVLHTLLGHYAMATNSTERAIQQFHTALQHTNNGDLRSLISLNLAVAYIKSDTDRQSELWSLMQALTADTPNCHSIKAAISYVQGLYMYTRQKLHDAKCHLRESLLLSNKHDLNKLTSCALVILGQIFLALGNSKETQDMAAPAMQLATKIPDKRLQVWAASLLADLYHTAGDYGSERSTREQMDRTSMEVQADVTKAVKSPNNSLSQWTVGEWPVTKATKQSYPAPTFTRVRTELPPQKTHRTSANSDFPYQHFANTRVMNSPRTPPRANLMAHVREYYDQDKMDVGHSQGSDRNSQSEAGSLTPRSLKNMELKLHSVVNSRSPQLGQTDNWTPLLGRTDSQSSTSSIKENALKTPEICLSKVTTPTGTPTSNRGFPFPGDPVTPSRKSDSEPRRLGEGDLARVNVETTPSRNQSARMLSQQLAAEPSKSPLQQPYGSSQQNDVQQQHRYQYRNASPQMTSQQLGQSSPHRASLSVSGLPPHQPSQSLPHHPMPHRSSHHGSSPSNPLSHPQHPAPPSYPSRQHSPQLNSLSPHLSHLSPGQAQSSVQQQQYQQNMSPEKSARLSPHHQQVPMHQHVRQERRGQLPQGNSPVKNAQPPGSQSGYRPGQMGAAQSLPQMSNVPHPMLQQSAARTSEQAMLQQRMLQQRQLLQQQQHRLNMQQQNSVGIRQQTSVLSHPNFNVQTGLPAAYYQQQMLAGLPQAMAQPSPGQLTHLHTLQKLGQESNRSEIGTPSDQVQMPSLHAYRAANAQQVQLMNGANIAAGGYVTQGAQLFPFNPHQPGR